MRTAASLSITFFLFLLERSASNKTLEAPTVESRSSQVTAGRWIRSFKSFIHWKTFSACFPKVPSIFLGRPTTILLISKCSMIVLISLKSSSNDLLLTVLRPCAVIPNSSLIAIPMECVPISNPMILIYFLLPIYYLLSRPLLINF